MKILLSVLLAFSALAATLFPTATWASSPLSNSGWIVMIPGAGSSGDQVYVQNFPALFGNRYFGGFEDELSKAGMNVVVCPKVRDHDTRTVEDREEDCVQVISQLAQTTEKRDVVLFGHSMGGLIARELAQDSRVKDRIKSVVLLSTPNAGTPFADFVMTEDALSAVKWNIEGFLATLEGFTPEIKRYLPELKATRTGEPSETFLSQDIADNADVDYTSFSTSFDKKTINLLGPLQALIAYETKVYGLDKTSYGDTNDGIVPEYSEVHAGYAGNVNSNHVEASCADSFRLSEGCSASLKILLPLLEFKAQLD
jgi:pimeloyl-ACP methyl ester carboxylesterase